MNMVNLLMSNAAIVLQNVVAIALLSALVVVKVERNSNALGDGKDLSQVLVRDVMELGTVVLRNDQGMTRRSRANIHKRQSFGSFKNL